MMGEQRETQPDLFYTRFNLEKRIRPEHPLRRVAERVDFDFVYGEVEDLYGYNGQVSIPPPVILKLLFLLFYYNVRSERELLATLPERLDWLWFLRLDLDSPIPDHSVLSKARQRWGADLFRSFFERVVGQCVGAGLVSGSKVFIDSSLVDANASEKSIGEVARVVDLKTIVSEMEQRLDGDEDDGTDDDRRSSGGMQTRSGLVSRTDPEAAVVRKRGGSRRARYKSHRAIDDAYGVTTATIFTAGNENEGHRLLDLVDEHERVTAASVREVVADSQYGTNENLLACSERAIDAHMPVLRDVNNTAMLKRRGFFTDQDFIYDAENDEYRCPAGRLLRRTSRDKKHNKRRYQPRQACTDCALKQHCTEGIRRSITRHDYELELERMRLKARSPQARADVRRRKHFMEGSFAAATRYGFKRCRWRGLVRGSIQDLLIATIQNIEILIRHAGEQTRAAAQVAVAAVHVLTDLRLRHHLVVLP